MNIKIVLVVLVALGLLVSGTVANAGTVTQTVAATATVGAIQTMTVATKTTAGNADTVPAKTIAFGTLSGSVSNAPAYIQVSYACNESLWKVSVYTNNTGADTSVLKFGRAGLLKSDGKDRVPTYWLVYKNPQTPATLTLTPNGVPDTRTSSVATGSKTVSDWAVMKDKTDLDDTGTVFNNNGTPTHDDDTGLNESWQYAFEGGYCDVMYGAPGYTNMNPFPYYDIAPASEIEGAYNADPAQNTLHRVGTTPVVIYVAAGGGFASAGSYSTDIGLDLYNE